MGQGAGPINRVSTNKSNQVDQKKQTYWCDLKCLLFALHVWERCYSAVNKAFNWNMKSRAVLGAWPAQTGLQSFHASLRKLLNTDVREFYITDDYFGTNAWTDRVNILVEVNTKNAKLKSLMKEQSYQMLLDVGRGKQNVKTITLKGTATENWNSPNTTMRT